MMRMEMLRRFKTFAVARIATWLERHRRDQQAREAELVMAQFGARGRDCILVPPFHITGPAHVRLGDNVHIGRNAFIRAHGGVEIGAHTVLSRNVVIYSVDHDYDDDLLPYSAGTRKSKVTIGSHVWVGMNVCILPGTNIGDGAIIGMGTVVSGNVPSGAIVGSEKWRVLKMRDIEKYDRLRSAGRFANPYGRAYEPGYLDRAQTPRRGDE